MRRAGIGIHEWAYLSFYLLYSGLLAAHGLAGTMAFAAIAGLLAGAVVVLAWARQPSGGLPERRVRWFYFMAGMPVCYYALGAGVSKFRPNGAGWLRSADKWLTGGHADAWLEAVAHPAVTELAAWGYMGFFPFLLLGLWRHGWMAEERAGAFFRPLGLLYAAGFMGYLLCPAAGPYRDFPSDVLPPPGWLGAGWNGAMVKWGSNGVDCFPSLHCAVSGLILVFDSRLNRRVFWWHLPVVAGIWFSTVYLRQHYLVDVLGALVLLGVSLWLGRGRRRGGMGDY